MCLTVLRPLPAFLTIFALLSFAAPACASEKASATTRAHIELYSPRVRRSTIMYLRLRLLELHEEGLDRARAAIERRLSIDDLLAPPERNTTPLEPAAGQKAKTGARRTVAP